ncbi:hypothetical protein D3C77_582960 [compost metagenome]
MIGLVDPFQAFKLRGKTTIAGSIDHHQRLAGKLLTQFNLLFATQLRQAALEQCRTVGGLYQCSGH